MHIKTIASAAILSAALGFGSVAYAQDAAATTDMALPTMIGNQELNEADAQRVKVYCEDLKTEANQAVGTESDSNEDETEEEEQTAVGSVDLDSITIANCLEAGFIEEPVTGPVTSN